MVDLSIVIVSYNVRYYLEQCLRSVFLAQRSLQLEVWVVDNASTDDSVNYLQERFPSLNYIANTENLGFSKANNQAIRRSQGRYVLLLNPDTIVGSHTLEDCVRFLDQHPEAGSAGVCMYDAYGRFARESRRGVPTPWVSFCKMSGLQSLFPQSRRFGRYYMLYLDRCQPNRIEVISGAYNILRREALEQVGLLDEDFFMYGEDVDLSYRTLQGGWENWYLPFPIVHYKGESTQVHSFSYVNHFYMSMLIFYNKHYARQSFWLNCLVRVAVVMKALYDIVLRMWWRAYVFFIPPEKDPDYIHCVGATEHVKDMVQAVEHKCAVVSSEVVSVTTDALHVPARCEVLVYDYSVYSYDEIIRLQSASKHSYSFAIYYPESGIIIQERNVVYVRKGERQ